VQLNEGSLEDITWKTSQHRPECGNTDGINSNGRRFQCLKCVHADDAERNGAKNIELLGWRYSIVCVHCQADLQVEINACEICNYNALAARSVGRIVLEAPALLDYTSRRCREMWNSPISL
jgi:hypothetical protein